MRKITLFLMSKFLTVGAMAQITDANELSNENCYHITSKDANRSVFYAPEDAEYLTTCAGTYGNYPNRGIQATQNSNLHFSLYIGLLCNEAVLFSTALCA